ncbi:MAG: ParA family protein [Geminicoccaceae bacterium]|nr:ParA family protein [Geminicoccaceae bacterium]MCS7266731.1 ParA family protein [Geminicoccaceae bacterium]MCX7628648.1 ParA family protein [Geminicoccaceae bacterium]MDW8123753.1 ParA family protein [Geminicoccaceae bacterium]MDW8341920.1 ParA family protein [Geminicoccaceae bacterium]
MGVLLAIGNLKGGVGKSTLAVNLASAFAAAGWSTVLIDTDPQQTATRWSAHRLLPCRVATQPIRDLADAGAWAARAQQLRQEAEVVVVDLPSVAAPALGAACLMASALLIPSGASQTDATTLQRTLHYLRSARRERADKGPLAWIVPTRIPRPGLFHRRLELGPLPELGEPLTPPITIDAAWDAAFASGRWIGDAAPDSRAHKELLAIFRAVVDGLKARGLLSEPAPRASAREPPSPAELYLQRTGRRRNLGPAPLHRVAPAE